MAVARTKAGKAAAPASSGRTASSADGEAEDAREALLSALTAAAEGDFSVRLRTDGPLGEVAGAYNHLAELNRRMESEVVRIGRVVGREGRTTERASLESAGGSWARRIDAINALIDDLARPTTEVARVIDAVAEGDLSQKMALKIEGKALKGEYLRIGTTVNAMVDQLGSFADEVTRVAREVGTEGKLGGQAEVEGVSGTWRDLTENVNSMAGNLTDQVRNISQVATAVARGDLSQEITVEAKGEVAVLAETINTMVGQLSSFADEVTRMAREVGTEGKLGGQAQVEGVSGTWRDLTENVNSMAVNLTDQVRNISQVTTAVAEGDLSQKITVDAKGEILELKDTINTMVDQLGSFADEVTRMAREVGTEGKLGGQAQVKGVSGTWRDLTENVNSMAGNLTDQVRNISQVATAVASGDLSQKITVDARGEILELKDTVNTMVDQLNAFAAEVTRVAREVGTEGKLGGQAQVEGVSGTWRDLTENVNFMATNLTDQVRNIAGVTTAVAGGDLSQKITVDARGEILELKDTINTMVDQLGSFADEVTRMAREVGTEGKLGGQAQVQGVSGTWRDLTQNVNQLAGNLTTQVRAIAEVSTAVTQGDLTRSIAVEASGEVADLKDNINQMIANLRDTTQRTEEQDWLKTSLARMSGLMQGQGDVETVSQLIMSELTPTVSAQHGAFFLAANGDTEHPELRLMASYGYKRRRGVSDRFALGEGLVGQAALERKSILLADVPTGYVKVSSGLGGAPPANLIVMPVLFEDQVMGVIELGSLWPFSELHRQFLDQLMETIGVSLSRIVANRRTEELLEQSQSLTQELQSQSVELRQTNEELQEKAALLSQQNRDIEVKNREIELARTGLEEKADQLAVSSRYKSEFLANMSHELRTPLNSLLILSDLLAGNEDGRLTEKQVEFAQTIHSAGSDLLALINDILDLSKVEAGRMDVRPAPVALADVKADFERSFEAVAEQSGLAYSVELADGLPESIVTDEQRLQQILKNLLSNAFKFTDAGSVTLRVEPARGRLAANGESPELPGRVAFAVTDTGIGIPDDKLASIFEAFQQADGTTSRRYGGTGLGLSISREIAALLGGELRAESVTGRGSTFTLYLPRVSEASVRAPVGAPAPAPAEPVRLPAAPLSAETSNVSFEGRKILIVDDDVRNVFALTAVLEPRGATVLFAENGRRGIEALESSPDIDLVLMDLMMPELDGYETTRTVRAMPEFRELPIVALTAKAMRGDREKSLAAGASEYITKPVDVDRLLTVMSAWLER